MGQLIESGIQAVKDCEAENGGTGGVCEQLAATVMDHMIEDAGAQQETTGWIDLVSEQDLKENFEAFDKDGSGEIDLEEFKAVLKSYMDRALSGEEAEKFVRIFQAADTNSNGSLNMEEFGKLVGLTDEDLSAGTPQVTVAGTGSGSGRSGRN